MADENTKALLDLMREIGRKARERALTEEILAEILQEEPKPTKLPDWCNVYEGMTDEEIDDIERAIVRNRTSRELSDCDQPEVAE